MTYSGACALACYAAVQAPLPGKGAVMPSLMVIKYEFCCTKNPQKPTTVKSRFIAERDVPQEVSRAPD